MFRVVNVYLDHLKVCVVYINRRRYVCCSECNVVSNECNVVSNECNEPTSSLVHGREVIFFGAFALGVSLVS